MKPLTQNDIQDIGSILLGYESWKRQKIADSETPGKDPLSVSVYLDEYAKMRALEILTQIQALYADGGIPWQEIDAEIRNLIGVE